MLTCPQVPKFPHVFILGVSNTQTCGVETSELRCVRALSFVAHEDVSRGIRLGFKYLLGWSCRRKLIAFLPAALCLCRWCQLWVLLGSDLVLYVGCPEPPGASPSWDLVPLIAAWLYGAVSVWWDPGCGERASTMMRHVQEEGSFQESLTRVHCMQFWNLSIYQPAQFSDFLQGLPLVLSVQGWRHELIFKSPLA